MQQYDWNLHPQTEVLLHQIINEVVSKNSFATFITKRMMNEASLRFFDWIDHMIIPDSSDVGANLLDEGYIKTNHSDAPDDSLVLIHPNAIFFPVILYVKGMP